MFGALSAQEQIDRNTPIQSNSNQDMEAAKKLDLKQHRHKVCQGECGLIWNTVEGKDSHKIRKGGNNITLLVSFFARCEKTVT